MENASKALIIAGSIIISLVIVSLGIMIYKKVQGATDVSDVTKAQVEAHNSEYEAYFGDYVSAANTKALLQKIKTNNTLFRSENGTAGETMPVFVKPDYTGGTGNATMDNISTIIGQIRSSRHYKISVPNEATTDVEASVTNAGSLDEPSYHANGYIKIIRIEDANTSTTTTTTTH